MRLIDLENIALDTTEQFHAAAGSPTAFLRSCRDMLPEERCRAIANLCDLAQVASRLANLAADDLAEGD